jgi:hypothetical protein
MPNTTSARARRFAFCLVLGLLAPHSYAQDSARLPYDVAYRFLQLFETLEHLERITPSMAIASTQPGVTPADIELTLDDGSGTTFRLEKNGSIDLPSNPSWADSGATLVSNQPKGTMRLEIEFKAVPITSRQTTYSNLMALASEFGEAMAALAELQGNSPPTVNGLTIQMPPGGTIELLAKRKQTLEPNSAGLVVMKTDQRLLKENPEIIFSELPLGILPLQ